MRSVASMRAPDPAFADPRLAVLYDVFEADRRDLDAYVAIAEEVAATRIVDMGCGTGSLAVRFAALDLSVIGIDPAAASLEVARGKPHAERVTWVHGDATVLEELDGEADLAVMTGNVAQVFVSDDDWARTLDAVRACLRPNGWLVFETRRPEVRDWEHWDLAPTPVHVPGGATVVVARRVTRVEHPLISFETTTTIGEEVVPSCSTIRFRERHEVEGDLAKHGFDVIDVREAPDRPGKELVFLARRIS